MTALAGFIGTLRQARQNHGLSVSEMAGLVGVAKPTVIRWEGVARGATAACTPRDDTLRRWAAILQVPVPEGVHGAPVGRCGTRHGYRLHLERRRPPCDACLRANTDRQLAWLRKTGSARRVPSAPGSVVRTQQPDSVTSARTEAG